MGITVRGSVQLSNASISTYEVRDGQEHGQMLSLNDTCHLDGHLQPRAGRPRPE